MSKNNTLQFMKGVLLQYEESLRQTGRTTRDVEEAIKTGAILVCRNYGQARLLSDKFGIETVSLDRYMGREYHIGRRNPPKFIFEHFCEYVIIMQKLEEAERIMNETSGKYQSSCYWQSKTY
jgi:hypothetical protein